MRIRMLAVTSCVAWNDMNASSDATINAPTAEYCLASFISQSFKKAPDPYGRNGAAANEYMTKDKYYDSSKCLLLSNRILS